VLYYAFPVMLPAIAHDTGWSAPAATAAFSAALVVSALAGIPVGHLIDRIGPRRVMTAGSVLGAGAVAVIAVAPDLPLFTAGWMLGGLAMAATFYQPAFAALTRWYGPRRVRALTTLTLAGGLASTIFAPITAALTEHLGWRHAALALALVILLIAAPLHATALRGPWPRHAPELAPEPAAPLPAHAKAWRSAGDMSPGAIITSGPFLLLAAALTLSGFAMYAVVFGLIPLLTQRGASPTQAAWAVGSAASDRPWGGSSTRRWRPTPAPALARPP
jgi:MFS family permease